MAPKTINITIIPSDTKERKILQDIRYNVSLSQFIKQYNDEHPNKQIIRLFNVLGQEHPFDSPALLRGDLVFIADIGPIDNYKSLPIPFSIFSHTPVPSTVPSTVPSPILSPIPSPSPSPIPSPSPSPISSPIPSPSPSQKIVVNRKSVKNKGKNMIKSILEKKRK